VALHPEPHGRPAGTALPAYPRKPRSVDPTRRRRRLTRGQKCKLCPWTKVSLMSRTVHCGLTDSVSDYEVDFCIKLKKAAWGSGVHGGLRGELLDALE